MHPEFRQSFNAAFTEDSYRKFIEKLNRDFPGQLDFRVAESPVFIDRALRDKLIGACDSIVETVCRPDFRELTERAIPVNQRVPFENEHTSFLAIDFALCRGADGTLEPQLIELQGFPSVFGYQLYLSELFREQYQLSDRLLYNFTDQEDEMVSYLGHLKEVILGEEDPENVILLEIMPEKQKTRIDFTITSKYLGIQPVCISKVIRDGRKLYYKNEGRLIPINRIYNRLIFDDLNNFPDFHSDFRLTDEVDVQWVGHPNWFFRISKFTLPFLKGPYFPETEFLSAYEGNYPDDLENFVLKPLFSFAGTGVELNVTPAMLAAIPDPENYILQRKVEYEPAILTNDGSKVKAEIRMLYIWPDSREKPTLLTALSRLSRGKMIGVRFNQDMTWVGGSAVFFEK